MYLPTPRWYMKMCDTPALLCVVVFSLFGLVASNSSRLGDNEDPRYRITPAVSTTIPATKGSTTTNLKAADGLRIRNDPIQSTNGLDTTTNGKVTDAPTTRPYCHQDETDIRCFPVTLLVIPILAVIVVISCYWYHKTLINESTKLSKLFRNISGYTDKTSGMKSQEKQGFLSV